MQPVRLWYKTIFSQSVSKFELGDRKKCIRKEGAQPHFLQGSPEIWIYGWEKWKKKCMKRKGNNVGLCPFLPMTRQDMDLGMGKFEKYLSEKCEKQIFVLISFGSIIKSLVYYHHQISLAYAMPKHASCYKRICSRLRS